MTRKTPRIGAHQICTRCDVALTDEDWYCPTCGYLDRLVPCDGPAVPGRHLGCASCEEQKTMRRGTA